ncbi:MAG: FIST C-terminal domain-containing protein [Solirubrobacterales bacterium]|nr:FIST C-terminal domain-containing protein [Solirubrobacterales bacterium]
MSVRAGCGLSTLADPVRGARVAAEAARAQLGPHPADLVFAFCSGAHLEDPAATLAALNEVLAPGTLAGCGAAGVVGDGREIEEGTAISIWAGNLGDARAEAFHAAVETQDDGLRIDGFPVLEGASALILLPDPYSFPTEQVLAELPGVGPGVPVLGGLASASGPEGAVLLCDEQVHTSGAVGVRLDGLEILPCVSQGATPIGPELTVTAGEGNIIAELAGRPALTRLREAVEALDEEETAMLTGGLLLGLVIDAAQTEYVQGDFLVRGLLGADPDRGAIAVGAPVEPGSIVRLHARDARSADAELRRALELRRTALGGAAPAGVVLFTCNGRGRGMFGTPDHDAAAIAELLAGTPTAGFFAGGEIGPVGGQPFLHSFTATAALFT